MATVRYTTINGRVIAEKRGGVRKLYRPDHLGSTIAMYDNTQTKTDTWVYWPYGAVRTRTGTTATPFQFVGVLGYFRDSSDRTYVRARVYRQALGIWQTRDPLWPNELSYSYGLDSPSTQTDPSGEGTCQELLDRCLARADAKQDACIRKVMDAASERAKYCLKLPEPSRTGCLVALNLEMIAGLDNCHSKFKPDYRLCGLAYLACLKGEETAHALVCIVVAAAVTYCVYRCAKAVVGILAAPGTGGTSTILIWTP